MPQKLEAIIKKRLSMKESLNCPFSPLLAKHCAPELPPFSCLSHLMNQTTLASDWGAWGDGDAFKLNMFGAFSSDGRLWL